MSASSNRWPRQVCSASSVFSAHPASTNSRTSASSICAPRCRRWRVSACRCWRTRNGRGCWSNRIRDEDPRRYSTWLNDAATGGGACRDRSACWTCPRTPGARVHIVHLASADALPSIADARHAGVSGHRRNVSALPRRSALRRFAAGDTASSARRRSASAIIASVCGRRCATARSIWSPPITLQRRRRLKHLDDGNFIAAWGGIASLQAVFAGDVDRRRAARHAVRACSPSGCAAAPARLAGLAASQRRHRESDTTPISSSSIPIVSSDGRRHHASIIVMPSRHMMARGFVASSARRCSAARSDLRRPCQHGNAAWPADRP